MRRFGAPGRRTAWALGSVLLALGGAALVAEGLRDLQPPQAQAPVVGSELPAEVLPVQDPAPRRAPMASAAAPVRLSIPAIGLSRPLLRLGLNRDGTVEVPSSRQAGLPGWFRLGPAPGEQGSAVILGHVDSVRGPAVFSGLRSLVRGDRVDVGLVDGRVQRFVVRRVRTYANEDFPARRVYGSHGYAGLQLVTCTGAYDPVQGYQANLVVYTRLLRTLPSDPQGAAASRRTIPPTSVRHTDRRGAE